MSGKANKYFKYPDLDNTPVSEEYKAGYQDAHEAVLRDARSNRIHEDKQDFLQD